MLHQKLIVKIPFLHNVERTVYTLVVIKVLIIIWDWGLFEGAYYQFEVLVGKHV